MPENKTEERPPQLDNVRDNATQEDFKMKNKVWEMLEYAGPQLEEFPRAKRGLAVPIRGSSFNNTSNGGAGALNLNNPRSNVNNNVSFRSASPHICP